MKKLLDLPAAMASALPVMLFLLLLQSCSTPHFIGQEAGRELLQQPELRSAQVGISLYDPASAGYLYRYQDDKYFIPASNTKLFTLYAGMKYLGDSLTGIRYRETDTALFVIPCGDPSFLHPAFPRQPVMDLLKKINKNIYLSDANWQEKALGRGWAWDDYNDDYMPERSSLPVYGNVIRWFEEGKTKVNTENVFDNSPSFYSVPEVDWQVRFGTDTGRRAFFVERERDANIFHITEGREKYKEQDVPFITDGLASAAGLLKDTVGTKVFVVHEYPFRAKRNSADLPGTPGGRGDLIAVHTQPTDTLFRSMMYRSDNFFAEQTLLMVSNERLGLMNDGKIIDTLLKSDLKELPQKPFWVDGCGLSRNDLFTPMDFVWLLNKMSTDFGLARMKAILPTGGTGTLSSYYKQDSGYIFAKTGSLSGVMALSGYLVTHTNRLLIFSVLVNNYSGSGTALRRKVERLLHAIREKY
jgi:D-alanyl-D-alanine carboxypeptidase/D-alanyl-D-alanine-endopeptidase (penicillin-binding protein 4)